MMLCLLVRVLASLEAPLVENELEAVRTVYDKLQRSPKSGCSSMALASAMVIFALEEKS